MPAIIHRQENPDGTVTIYYDDRTNITVGTPIDPVTQARQAGQTALARTRTLYEDPWYQENVLGPMNRSTEQQAKEKAIALQQQARRLELEGRRAEADILNQQANIEFRKAELMLNANTALAQMRGPGNAAQMVDIGERTKAFGTQTGSLAQIAAGGMPTGAFGTGMTGKPVSMQDRMSGMLGAPSQGAIMERDRNDRALARQIYSTPGQLARGSLESLGKYRRAYLGSYGEAEGFDDGLFQEAYDSAGIHQGRR